MSADINVLVVDDDEDICDYMEMFLGESGYAVTTVTAGEKALAMLRKATFHLAIIDLMMPSMNGIELLEEIRKVDDDIPIILFTGHPTVETAIQAMRFQVSDYVRKPFSVDEFTKVIESCLRKQGLIHDPEEMLLVTIGISLRDARKSKGLTLKQLSRRTGLSVSLISQIERAESSASISSLFKLARALELPLTSFFGDH